MVSRGSDSYSGISFLIFQPLIHFWENLGQKYQSCPFCLKVCAQCIWRMLILIPTLVFWICNPNFTFGKIWAEKVKSCSFCLKIGTQSISRMLILIPILFSWNPKPKSVFWENLSRKSRIVYLPGSWHTGCLEDVIARILRNV